jgi:hypothetical protein
MPGSPKRHHKLDLDFSVKAYPVDKNPTRAARAAPHSRGGRALNTTSIAPRSHLERGISVSIFRREKFQLVAHAGARAKHRMRGQFQHAVTLQRNPGNPEGSDVLLKVHDVFFAVEKDQVDRKQHADRVDPVRGDDPEAAPRTRPLARFSEEADQPAKIGIGHRDIRRDESLARPI